MNFMSYRGMYSQSDLETTTYSSGVASFFSCDFFKRKVFWTNLLKKKFYRTLETSFAKIDRVEETRYPILDKTRVFIFSWSTENSCFYCVNFKSFFPSPIFTFRVSYTSHSIGKKHLLFIFYSLCPN